MIVCVGDVAWVFLHGELGLVLVDSWVDYVSIYQTNKPYTLMGPSVTRWFQDPLAALLGD